MKKTSIIIILLLFFFSLFSSCHDTEFPDDPYQTIVGNWESELNRTYYTADNMPLGSNAPLMYRPIDHAKAYFEFSNDKKYIEFNQKGEIISYGIYSIEHRTLTLQWDNKHSINYTIVSFGQNNLWLRYTSQCGIYEGKNLRSEHDIILKKQ